MTWKEILKIDMDEARKLGEKYLPRDMEEGRAEVQREEYAKRKAYHEKLYQKMKEAVMDVKNETPASRLKLIQEALEDILEDMKGAIGEYSFKSIYGRLGNYPEMWPSMKSITMSRYL